jgi:hypothetical protein
VLAERVVLGAAVPVGEVDIDRKVLDPITPDSDDSAALAARKR